MVRRAFLLLLWSSLVRGEAISEEFPSLARRTLRFSAFSLLGLIEVGGDVPLSDRVSVGAYLQYWGVSLELAGVHALGGGLETRWTPFTKSFESGVYFAVHAGARDYSLGGGVLFRGAKLLGVDLGRYQDGVGLRTVGGGVSGGYQFVFHPVTFEMGLGVTKWFYPRGMNANWERAVPEVPLSSILTWFPVLVLNVGVKL